jgi:hypothetical protein
MVSSEEEYVLSPTFSEKVRRVRVQLGETAHPATQVHAKKKQPQLPAFPDAVRTHHLPLVMKSSRGDSLQVYVVSYAKKDPEIGVVYDVEFDDGTLKENVPRNVLSVPPATSYQLMRLQDSQESISRTPVRRRPNR